MLVPAAVTTVARAQPLGLAAEEGVLLLRNGQVLQGKITPDGDRYLVSLPSGEVRLKTSDVELHCRSLEDAYLRKRSGVQSGNVHEHLNLAQWCIQQELLGCAANEIRAAMTLEPRNPRIALVQRKLDLAHHKPAIAKATTEPVEPSPTADELDRLTRGLPPGAVEVFTNSIQPLLLNNCTAAGCHGPGAGNPHRWVRTSLGRTSSRRLTQRNLHTTMQLIDREKPLESLLLTVPLQPHAGAKTAMFANPQGPQFRQLMAWVQQVAQTPATPQPASVESQATTLSQPAPVFPGRNAYSGDTIPLSPDDQQPLEPLKSTSSGTIDFGAGPIPLGTQRQRDRSASGFVPKDPFDPEIFNRRFFPAAKP